MTRELEFRKQQVNLELLDAELRAALGEVVYGVSASADDFIVHLVESATAVQQEQVGQIVAAHDASKQTPAQVKGAAMEALRARYLTQPLDPQASLSVKQVAERVVWLEQELLALREGGEHEQWP